MAHQVGSAEVGANGEGLSEGQSLGTLVSTAMRDFSALLRMEKDLARAEIQQAIKGVIPIVAGGAIAAVVGLPALLMFSVWAALGIGHWIPTMWGFFCMFVFWSMIIMLGGLIAFRAVRRLDAKPERTIRTIKDTADWARHPTVAPTTEVDTLARS
jgi:sterol desaturase/sphingolipid hydroxylase (fatty acid hydroxylase superfamily)